jgi:HAD superfamily hydrolase (TIGR01459 family)
MRAATSAGDPHLHGEGVEIVRGLGSVACRYDLVLCDVWGVLHNGIEAYAGASDALTRYRAGGGRVVLVSNAPRPAAAVIDQLDAVAVPRTAYDAVVTSGDLTRAAVATRTGQVLHHIGPARDEPLFAGLEVRFGSLEEAEYVVCTGLWDDEREVADDYRPTLDRMRDRSLLMVCANPDLVVERGDRLVPCAGSLALLYEESGGEVFYAGKPHRPIYDAALDLGAKANGGKAFSPSRVVAVGDAIRTDIAGAVGAGLPSILVAEGIHAAEIGPGEGALDPGSRGERWLARQSIRPDAVMRALVW